MNLSILGIGGGVSTHKPTEDEPYGWRAWVYGAGGADWRALPVTANGQPGFAAYRRDGGGYALHTLQILTVTADGVSRNSVFQDPAVFASFDLPDRLDDASQSIPAAPAGQGGRPAPSALNGADGAEVTESRVSSGRTGPRS